MGTGTLTDRSSGQTILDTFFNDIHSAMNGDFVGRNSSGAATSAQNLGTTSVPWGTARITSLVLNGASVDPDLLTAPSNRVVSGKVRTTSNQPAYITPNGAAASFIVYASATNLVVDISGATVTATTDITKSSLTVAPSSANTTLVNDLTAGGQEDTKTWGEAFNAAKQFITVDAMGSEISNLVGKYCAFKTSTEYFLAYVESTTKLSRVMRGFFYGSDLVPLNRVALSDNQTITLMKLGWVFLTNDGTTIDVTYTNPVWDFTSPSSPATGDYWYDMANSIWKRYDGASFQTISRTLIGMVVMDDTNCVAARCIDFYAKYEPLSTMDLELSTVAIVRTKVSQKQVISIAGVRKLFEFSVPQWNITADLASTGDAYNTTEQADRYYYFYIKDTGDTVISDIEPYLRQDLFGYYHPHNPWRCVGYALNNSGSDLQSVTTLPTVGEIEPIEDKGRNYLINGAFDFWQRPGATSQTIANAATTYVADRWYGKNALGTNGVLTFSRQSGTVDGARYAAKLLISTAPTASQVNGCELWQVMDRDTSARFYNKNASFSAFITAFGNVNQIGIQLFSATTETKPSTAIGTEVFCKVHTGGATLCKMIAQAVGTGATTAGVIGIRIRIAGVSSGNTYDLNNGFMVQLASLTPGDLPLAVFERAGITLVGEAAACQRFYEKSSPMASIGIVSHGLFGQGGVTGTSGSAQHSVRFAVNKRVAPTVYTWNHDGTGSGSMYYTRSGVGEANGTATPSNVGEGGCTFVVDLGGASSWVVHYLSGIWAADSEI